MSKTRLILGVINSQPSGLDQSYYESVYQKYYKPFLTVLSKFPEIPFNLYYSGRLLEWLELKHPEAIMLLTEMVKRKQVELLGGGFYEPILPVIPNSDRTSQIENLTSHIRKRFGRRPRGGWLGEMIWEPNLPISLKNAGLDYTLLNDSYFKIAGARGEELNIPCITEEQGKTVIVFPLDSELKSYVLENTPEDSFAYLMLRLKSIGKKDSGERVKILSLFFKGEEWKDSDVGSWLKVFLSLILSERKTLNLDLLANCAKLTSPIKKMYFPSLIPGLMMPGRKDSPRHNTARNLLTVYPEINLLYSKQLYVNNLIKQLRGDKSRKKTARQGILKAQQSSLYWYPEEKADTYRPMRQEAYRILLSTEKLSRETGIFQTSIVNYDFDMDGATDYLYQGNLINVYIRRKGARVFEFDYLTRPWNFQDTHCHWAEPRGNRDSFIETFFSGEEHPRKNGTSRGFSLMDIPFELDESEKDKNRLAFHLETSIPDNSGKSRPISLNKTYNFKKNGFNIIYEIINNSDHLLEFYFTTEANINFASNDHELKMDYISRGIKKSDGSNSGSYRDVKHFHIKDKKNKTSLAVDTSKNCDLIRSTQEIIDEKHGPLYQGTRFMLGWKKKAEPGKSWSVELNLRLE